MKTKAFFSGITEKQLSRLVAWVSFVSILIIFGSSIWTYQKVDQLTRDTAQASQTSVIQSLSVSLTDKFLTRDFGGLENLLRLAMEDQAILSILLTDLQGSPITFLRRDALQPEPKAVYVADRFNPPELTKHVRYGGDEDRFITVWQPISAGSAVGWVRIEFSNERSQEVTSNLINSILIALVLMLAGLITVSAANYLKQHREMAHQRNALIKQSQQSSREVIRSHIAMMEALGLAIAKRDSDTGEHNYRVTLMAIALGEELGIARHEMQRLIVGSFLHDIGKIGIPDSILCKPGSLNEQEMDVMRTHVRHGVEMVRDMGWLNDAHDVVAYHHEKWDGSGYPEGLSGEAIPQAARIFAVVDVFDALCSVRPYKQPLSFAEVIEVMKRQAKAHFDPAIFETFTRIAPRLYTELENQELRVLEALIANMVKKYFYGETPPISAPGQIAN